MSVTAVVVSYWPNRTENVARIVEDLDRSTVRPDHVLVLDNGGHFARPNGLGGDALHLEYVQPTFNTWTRGKFIAALLQPADWYILIDDDTSVGPGTVAALRSYGENHGVEVSGYWGVQLRDGSFMQGTIITPQSVDHPVEVDAFHGRVMWMSHAALCRMLALEQKVRARWPHEGDDIIAGLANPGCSFVVPLPLASEAFVDLDQCGQALQFQDGYFDDRDRFTLDVLAARAGV